jgi:hypothetical protein
MFLILITILFHILKKTRGKQLLVFIRSIGTPKWRSRYIVKLVSLIPGSLTLSPCFANGEGKRQSYRCDRRGISQASETLSLPYFLDNQLTEDDDVGLTR